MTIPGIDYIEEEAGQHTRDSIKSLAQRMQDLEIQISNLERSSSLQFSFPQSEFTITVAATAPPLPTIGKTALWVDTSVKPAWFRTAMINSSGVMEWVYQPGRGD